MGIRQEQILFEKRRFAKKQNSCLLFNVSKSLFLKDFYEYFMNFLHFFNKKLKFLIIFSCQESAIEQDLKDFFGYFNFQMYDEISKKFEIKCINYVKNFGDFSNLNCALKKDV